MQPGGLLADRGEEVGDEGVHRIGAPAQRDRGRLAQVALELGPVRGRVGPFAALGRGAHEQRVAVGADRRRPRVQAARRLLDQLDAVAGDEGGRRRGGAEVDHEHGP
ncbi:hypothetical protein [Dactylosporangium sp. CS-033363]|uniref:hypothetical protein n=1 Tax=Dactylosporangium sp. CS-033363 TaxID=3239935 RepID=UPI003D8C9981